MSSFTYIIAVDFEATCWENQPRPQFRDSEIIEFPAVLINLKTGKIEAEFHKYIKPTEKPILSNYCRQLTGIKQEIVDNGVVLEQALTMFKAWLHEELTARNLVLPTQRVDKECGNCALATWTDWDFKICLAKECRRKSLQKPKIFDQWIDVRLLYNSFYNYRPANFSDALRYANIDCVGRLHTGIGDAKNLAALVYDMARRGFSLIITSYG